MRLRPSAVVGLLTGVWGYGIVRGFTATSAGFALGATFAVVLLLIWAWIEDEWF